MWAKGFCYNIYYKVSQIYKSVMITSLQLKCWADFKILQYVHI